MAGAISPQELDSVVYEIVQYCEPVLHAARAAGKVDDEGAAADAGGAAGERGAGEAGIDGDPERLGDARRLRSSTAFVASGVTSRGVRPVPPVVRIRSAVSASAQAASIAAIRPVSSGTRSRAARA